MRTFIQNRALFALALVALTAAACDKDNDISNPDMLASIAITPNPQTLAAGSSQQFTAVGTSITGGTVALTPVWSVAQGGGTISSGGVFTAGPTAGTFPNTVMVSSGGMSATATVTVTVAPLASITVSPTPVSLGVGTTQQFTAVGRDAAGNIVPITPVWSLTAGGGAVNGSGMFTAGATLGTFTNTVRATSGGLSGTATVNVVGGPLATITVTPDPATLDMGAAQQFTAVGRDASGNVVALSPTWSVTNGGGAINSAGVFTAGQTAGTFSSTVTATSGSLSGSASVTVRQPVSTLASITVSPDPSRLGVGGVQQFTAVGRDASGAVVAITPTWSVVNAGGTIDSNGLFRAGTRGGEFERTVRASSGNISGTATVIVTAPPPPPPPSVVTITVTPNPATVQAGQSQTFTAVGRDANNNPIAITPTWSVVNGGGTINASTGQFTAGNTGGTFNNTVRATQGTVFGQATVTVTAAASPPFVNLGAAAPNGIMAGTAVTCVIGGFVHADVSISPGNTLTGFGPCVITGVKHLGDAVAAQAQIDLTNAYNTLMGLPCAPGNAIVADLGGTTKAAGTYCTASGIGVTGTLTLDGGGDPNAVFVFQAGTSLTTAGDIVLINGAQAKNVYWVIGSSATLGTASQWQGNILALTSITMVTGANLTGRALARNGAVTLGTNNVITLP